MFFFLFFSSSFCFYYLLYCNFHALFSFISFHLFIFFLHCPSFLPSFLPSSSYPIVYYIFLSPSLSSFSSMSQQSSFHAFPSILLFTFSLVIPSSSFPSIITLSLLFHFILHHLFIHNQLHKGHPNFSYSIFSLSLLLLLLLLLLLFSPLLTSSFYSFFLCSCYFIAYNQIILPVTRPSNIMFFSYSNILL